jgi:hypothetical protein
LWSLVGSADVVISSDAPVWDDEGVLQVAAAHGRPAPIVGARLTGTVTAMPYGRRVRRRPHPSSPTRATGQIARYGARHRISNEAWRWSLHFR